MNEASREGIARAWAVTSIRLRRAGDFSTIRRASFHRIAAWERTFAALKMSAAASSSPTMPYRPIPAAIGVLPEPLPVST